MSQLCRRPWDDSESLGCSVRLSLVHDVYEVVKLARNAMVMKEYLSMTVERVLR